MACLTTFLLMAGIRLELADRRLPHVWQATVLNLEVGFRVFSSPASVGKADLFSRVLVARSARLFLPVLSSLHITEAEILLASCLDLFTSVLLGFPDCLY